MNKPQIELDIETKKFLSDFYSIISSLDIPMLLIGAQARLLIFDIPYQIEGRATKDWDIAVNVDGWEKYNLLVHKMTTGNLPLFQKTRVIHKFIHRETQLEIDIIPFGNISNQNHEIIWSDGKTMSTLGLEEAFLNTQIEIIDDLKIRVADIDTFIALKLLAWNDRKVSKNLEDIITVLKKPVNAQEEEQIYIEFTDQI